MYFRIDRLNAGTAGQFRIYEDTIINPPIANFNSEIDSFLYSGFNGNSAVGFFILQSQDACNSSNMAESGKYSTIIPSGQLLRPTCSLNYELSWNQPTGFRSPIRRFEVYIDSSNTGFNLAKTINNASATSTILNIRKGVDYSFRLVAIDQSGAVNISAIFKDTISNNLRSFEIVPAPELLCTNIDSNGAVLLSFASPKDSTDNGVGYQFNYRVYRVVNSNWQYYSASSQVDYELDNQVLISGINAHQNDYEFRARTISGCDGATPSSYSSVFSTKGVNVLSRFVDYLYVEDSAVTSYQWYDCTSNFSFPGEKNNRFTPLDTGYYGVYIEYADCRDSSFCYFVDALDTGAAQLNYNTVESAEENAYYQWYDCREDTLIPGANSRRFIATDTGYYAVILTAYGYKDTSECIPMFSVGLDELNFENQLYVYPNPSSGLVNIELPQKQQSIQVKVRNIHGQLVQEEQFVNQGNLQLQLNGKAGIYFIELVNEQGERANVKVVKR